MPSGLPFSMTKVSTSLSPDTEQASWIVWGDVSNDVARLKGLFGLPIDFKHEVALYDVTAVDPRMRVTARASARRDLNKCRHGSIARR